MKKLIILIQVAFLFLTFTGVYSQWYPQTSPTGNALEGVCFTDANTGTAVGTFGTIVRTTNGGTNWILQSSGTTNHLIGVSFTDANNGTAVGIGGTILRTTNGGTYWTSITGVTTNNLYGVSFIDANTGTAVGENSVVFRTTNGGANWVSQWSQTGAKDLWGVCFIDANTGTVVGTLGAISSTINGGANWTPQTIGTGYDLRGVSFIDANNGAAVGLNGVIFRTTNGGAYWIFQTSGTTASLYGVSFRETYTETAVGSGGTILSTTNGGTNWTLQTSGTTEFLASVSFADANTGITVGVEGTILRTTNGGFIPPIPAEPVLTSPANGATLVATNPLLNWDNTLYAESYQVQVSIDALFAVIVYDSSNNPISEYQIPNNGLNLNTTYYWRVNASNVTGTSSWSIVFHFTTISTNISGNNVIPKEFRLYNSYPNPFNPITNIRFDIPKSTNVKIIIYNALGKEVTTLVNEKLSAESYKVDWNASGYPSGVYFYKIETKEFTETKKMVLVK